jgi:ribosomal protein L11 methyltransferase
MTYYEYTFTYTSHLPTDILHAVWASELGEIGFDSFEETAGQLKAYISEKLHDPEKLRTQINSFPLEGVAIHYSMKAIEDRDWNEEWEKNYFKPIEIDHQCLIRAPFHQARPGYAYELIIHPKMAFGTGNHETTYLMIREILQLDLSGKAVLDMGCGTALLAILAAQKGAFPVVAVDIDEWAYHNALENKRLNHTDQIRVLLGGAEQLPAAGPFDVVLANINRNILLNDIRHYALCMKPGATLLMSGFYTEDLPAIQEECLRNHLTLLSTSEKNHWATLSASLHP